MRIKRFVIFVLFFLFASCSIVQSAKSNGEVSKNGNVHNDSTYFDKKLPEFYVDSCLNDLLISVVKADINHVNYAPNFFFYSLNFFIDKNNRPYLSISPQLWKNSEFMDYTGIIKIGEMTFLCRGDFATDSRFHCLTFKKSRVKLKQAKKNTFNVSLIEEPSFQGSFGDCAGAPINIEIYIKGKIPGFEMDILKKK